MKLVSPLPSNLKFFSAAVLIATWGGIGLLRPAPGTWGSLAALPVAWLIMWLGGAGLLVIACFAAFGAGLWAAAAYGQSTGEHDASAIVIDEVVGQWIAVLFLPLNVWAFLLAFALFRIFDILKPWPIGWLDKNIEGAMGVMVDDVAAGIVALILSWAAWSFFVG